MTTQGGALYTKEYPSPQQLDMMELSALQSLAKSLEDDTSLIEEETRMFNAYLKAQQEKESAANKGKIEVQGDEDDEHNARQFTNAGDNTVKFKRGGRGGGHVSKSEQQKDVFMFMEDKHQVTLAEQERLKGEREKGDRLLEDARDLMRATIEEARNRIKEVKMEAAYFIREVAPDKQVPQGDKLDLTLGAAAFVKTKGVADREVSAEKILKYFNDRPAQKEQYILKCKEKCATLFHSVAKHQNHLKTREDQGEAFHLIDFDQLQIENQQFNERIEAKNAELVELKGTTTRTVQALNNLTDKLNTLLAEQASLKGKLKDKEEEVGKRAKEIESVKKEGNAAQKKNITLKLQNEAVKVPKVEDYIAQKAECYELEKAALNWQRKVEIASGHVAVMKQQMISLRKAMDPMASVGGASTGLGTKGRNKPSGTMTVARQ